MTCFYQQKTVRRKIERWRVIYRLKKTQQPFQPQLVFESWIPTQTLNKQKTSEEM